MKKYFSILVVLVAMSVSVFSESSKINRTIPPICPVQVCTPVN